MSAAVWPLKPLSFASSVLLRLCVVGRQRLLTTLKFSSRLIPLCGLFSCLLSFNRVSRCVLSLYSARTDITAS